jgi:hypothetical protein
MKRIVAVFLLAGLAAGCSAHAQMGSGGYGRGGGVAATGCPAGHVPILDAQGTTGCYRRVTDPAVLNRYPARRSVICAGVPSGKVVSRPLPDGGRANYRC